MTSSSKPIALALQGGGTHGAFTWGVLDRLLSDERLRIEAISATSGGAMMASVLAAGMKDGRARDALDAFWQKISIASGHLPLQMKIVDTFLGHTGIDLSPSTLALDMVTKIFSPYQFNLFDINPLRAIVEELVDFKGLNRKSPVALYINATNARTGKGRIFTEAELSLDAVMASACLPFVFKTVEVDGEPYWDGSFSACPALMPFTEHKGTRDVLLVQVHPNVVEDVPTTAADILDRATEISFHSVLMAELKTLDLSNRAAQRPVNLHRIEADAVLSALGRSSKLKADWDFLTYLHDLGAQAAGDWLEENFDKVGKTSTADISAIAA